MPRLLLVFFFLISVFSSMYANANFSGNSSTSQFDIQLNYDSYSVSDGLSQNTVSSFVEDNDGYIWVGTINGLNRFDGNEFKQFHADKNSPGLPSSFIRNLLLNDKGQIVIGTDQGLTVFNQKTETFQTLPISKSINKDAIWSLSQQNEEVFIGLYNKIIVTTPNYSEIKLSLIDSRFHEVKKIIKLGEQYFVRNYKGTIFEVNGQNVKVILQSSNDITLINNKLLISTKSGTFTGIKLRKISNLPFDIIDNKVNKNKHYAIASIKNNLYKINSELKISKIGTTSLQLNKSNSLYINNSGDRILTSNYDNGFVSISTINNLVKRIVPELKNIWSITKDKNYIYIATNENFIYKYDASFNLLDRLQFPNAQGPKFLTVLDDTIYVASVTGLYSKKENDPAQLISDKLITHLKNSNNGTIIAGTFDGELLEFNDQNKLINTVTTNVNYPIYDSLKINKTIWIASQNGLISISPDKQITLHSHEMVTSLERIKDKLFFGTTTALKSIDLKQPSHISEKFSNKKVIYSINKFDTFILTASGYEINIISTIKNSHIKLNKHNGVLSDYNIRSSLKLGNNLLFGGKNGLSLLNSNEVSDALNKSKKIKTNLKELLLFNTPLNVGSKYLPTALNYQSKIKLKYSDYPFSIKFNSVGRTFNTTDFKYKLEGLDQEWIPAQGVNSATYTNLSPGDYTFRIYAIDKLTGQKGIERNLAITITPPWWLSIQAKLVYALIILIIISIITRSIFKRRQIQRQVALSEERLKLSLWGSGDEMWDWDIESGQIYRSNIWGTLDFPRDGRRSGKEGEKSNIHPHDQHRVQKALNDHFSGDTDHFEIAYRVKGRDNQWNWILDRAKIVERDQKDLPVRMTGTIKDINKIKQSEEQLRLFARAIENISEGMFILDEKYRFVEVNDACCEITAKSREKFTKQVLTFNRYPEAFSEQIRALLKQQGRWTGEIEALRGNGHHFLMALNIDAIFDEQGDTSHYVGVFSDITHRKQQEEELRKLTNNDILTGLPNRSSLQVALSNLVQKDIHHTLMVLDIDNFKRINDSLGHQFGDDLLVGVAERIRMVIPNDSSLYRLGGDEFALLIDQTPDIGSSAAIASRVIRSLAPSFNINNESLVLGISIGIVLYPEDEQSEQALLRKADIAMYHAKSAGGNRYQFYSESLNKNAIKQLETENLIREALKEDLFEVYYQPKVDMKNDCLSGMEALVRLNHPNQGLIPPNIFIPLAEENGLIVEIGDVVLRKACFAAHKWLEEGIFTGRVAVNLSSRQFALSDLQQRIESILRLTKLPAKHLELEITEGTVIKNPEKAIKVMQQLSKMGITLALDDFGTGYSSLSYLKRFPINCLKIDKSFIDDIDKSDRDLKMVDSIITIAHNMGLSVVAEGVEQTAQLNILKALNCEKIQGYIYSKPIPENDFSILLQSNNERMKLKKQTNN